jgi:uncharacterized membrane protein
MLPADEILMDQRASGMIGVVGGIVDLVAGSFYLQQSMGVQPMMGLVSMPWIGYFLLALGLIVLVSGLYVLAARMMKNRSIFGWLMILYGLIMFVLGFGMIGQVFSMMQWSEFSGIVMIIVGIAMLYSGYGMARM